MHAISSNPVNPRLRAEQACCSPNTNSFGFSQMMQMMQMMQIMTALTAQLFSRSSGGLLSSGMPSFGKIGTSQSGLGSFLGGPQLPPTSAGGSGGGSRQSSIVGAGSAPTGATLTTTNSRSPKVSQQSDVPVPHGYNQIVSTFGKPGDSSNLTTTTMPAGPGGKEKKVTFHKKIAPKLKAAFQEIKAAGLGGAIKSFDGTYNPRKKRGGSTWSNHAWGIAVDINAGLYPIGTPVEKTSTEHKAIAKIMAKHGFYQIANDPHHFQYATGY